MMDNDSQGDAQMSVKEMEENESLKKVEWLRGRLIAERAASKHAKQEADEMECKVGELETQLKSEMSFSKRADKKLNFLIKKLNSLHIPYFPEDLDKSVVSSVTSGLTQVEEKDPKSHIKIHGNSENEGCVKRGMGQTGDKDFEDNVSQISSAGLTESEPCKNCNNAKVDNQRYSVQKEDAEDIDQTQGGSQRKTMAEDIGYVAEAQCEESKEDNTKINDKSSRYSVDTLTLEDEKDTNKGKSTEVQDDYVVQPLAIVLVDLPNDPPQVQIDPLILDANVQQVLESLTHAKQRLRFSMERRHTTRVESR